VGNTLGLDSAAAGEKKWRSPAVRVAAVQCQEQLEQLPGDVVVVFYDRNDPNNSHTGKQPGDEGAKNAHAEPLVVGWG